MLQSTKDACKIIILLSRSGQLTGGSLYACVLGGMTVIFIRDK